MIVLEVLNSEIAGFEYARRSSAVLYSSSMIEDSIERTRDRVVETTASLPELACLS